MNKLILDFEQAKSKHLLFKSRLRSILYDIDVDEGPVLSHHECSLGKWIYSHALHTYGHIPEMQELEMIHADIHITARKLVSLHREGKTQEAKTGLAEMEAVADKLIALLGIIEQKVEEQPADPSEVLNINYDEYHDLLRSNAELDKRIKQQIAESSESELRYETVLAALHEGVIIQDADGLFQSANHSAELLLGMTISQMQGLTATDPLWGITDEDGNPLPGDMHAPMITLRTGRDQVNQLVGVRKPLKPITWLRVNSRPLISKENGEMIGVVSSFFEVTESRKAEAELQKGFEEQQALNEEITATNEELAAVNEELGTTNEELTATQHDLELIIDDLAMSETRFRSLVDQSPIGIAVFKGHDLVIQVINNMMLEIWGKTVDVEGKTLATAMPELKGQPFVGILQNVFLTGQPYYGNEAKAQIERNGEMIEGYFNFICQAIRDKSGTITSVLQVVTEITQQVISRLELQKAEEMMRMAVDAARLGSWHIIPGTNALKYNNILAQIFGYEGEQDMTYDQAIAQVTDEYRPMITEAIAHAIADGGDYDITYQQKRFNDGELIWLRSFGKIAQDAYGNYTVFSGFVMDVTEQKEDEQRKNDFIGMVSHELKTPLTSLYAYLQMLQLRAKKAEDAFTSGALDQSVKQVKKMTSMVNGFLDVSRLESGKIKISKQHFDMALLVKESEEETVSMVTTHKFIFHPVKTTFVDADRDKISQVISNFISNAVKYSKPDSTIQIACVSDGESAVVSVSDEGIGIPEKDQEHLFDRYYRVQNDNTVSGFGIGLYLCAEIVHRHNGKIWVDSEIGKGSTFWFSIPMKEQINDAE